MSNLTRNIAAAIAVQVAAVIGKRRANRARHTQPAPVTINGFTIAPASYLALAATGKHGPEAQRAALRELADMRWFEDQMRDIA